MHRRSHGAVLTEYVYADTFTQRFSQMKHLACAVVVTLALGLGIANAQTNPPSTTPSTSQTDKQAISKTCSKLADARGLHGDARKKFRAECKKNGGKAPK